MNIEKFNLYGIDIPMVDSTLREKVGDSPLETEAQTITGAINELAQGGGGGAPLDYIKSASYDSPRLVLTSNKDVRTIVDIPPATTSLHDTAIQMTEPFTGYDLHTAFVYALNIVDGKADKADVPEAVTDDHINSLIDAKLTPLEALADSILGVI